MRILRKPQIPSNHPSYYDSCRHNAAEKQLELEDLFGHSFKVSHVIQCKCRYAHIK